MAEAGRRRRSGSPPSTSSVPDRPVTSAPSPYFPPELIPEVARRLTSLQDFFALRAACRAYRALLSLTTSNLASQAPLLLLTPHNLTQPHALFHLPLRRIHRFRLPHITSIPDANDVAIRFHALGCRLAVCKSNYSCRTKRRISIIHLLTGKQECLPNPRAAISRLRLFGDLVVAWCRDDTTASMSSTAASGPQVAHGDNQLSQWACRHDLCEGHPLRAGQSQSGLPSCCCRATRRRPRQQLRIGVSWMPN